MNLAKERRRGLRNLLPRNKKGRNERKKKHFTISSSLKGSVICMNVKEFVLKTNVVLWTCYLYLLRKLLTFKFRLLLVL